MSNTFNEWLKAYRLHRDPWTDLYPPENILAGYSQGPLIVDVGGNLGEDLELFRRKYPAHGQQLILQDLPDKVARATCSAEVQRMAHNFFTAQPTLARGARVYHLHSIIHDWDDSDAGRILGHIRDAMIPGYSKLLINDVIIPVRQPSRRDTSVDVHMMVKLGGRERTDDMLRGLVEKLGLKVCGVWGSGSSETSIMEVELPFPKCEAQAAPAVGVEVAGVKQGHSVVERQGTAWRVGSGSGLLEIRELSVSLT